MEPSAVHSCVVKMDSKFRGQPLLDSNGNKVVAYICPYIEPVDYSVIKNSDGKIIKSVFLEDKETLTLNKDEGEFVEDMHYSGCPTGTNQHQKVMIFSNLLCTLL